MAFGKGWFLEVLKEIGISTAVATALELAFRRWWDRTIDDTHRSGIGRVFAAMAEKGFGADVSKLTARLNAANSGNSRPLEDEMARALHCYIPTKYVRRGDALVKIIDWSKMNEAIKNFRWLANLSDDEFKAVINSAIHDPIRQNIKLAGNYVSEVAKTAAASTVNVAKTVDGKLGPVAAWTGTFRGVQTKGKLW